MAATNWPANSIQQIGNRVDNDVNNQLWFIRRRYASVCDVHNNILFFSQLMYYTNSLSDRSDRNISMLSWDRSLRNQRNDLGAFRMNLINAVCGRWQRVAVLLRPYVALEIFSNTWLRYL